MTELSWIVAGIALTISLLRLAQYVQTRQTAPITLSRTIRRSASQTTDRS